MRLIILYHTENVQAAHYNEVFIASKNNTHSTRESGLEGVIHLSSTVDMNAHITLY